MSDEAAKTGIERQSEAAAGPAARDEAIEGDARAGGSEGVDEASAGAQAGRGLVEQPGAVEGDVRLSAAPAVGEPAAIAIAETPATTPAEALAPPVAEPSATPLVDPPGPVADPQLKAIIEALVFASPEPLTPKMLFKLLEGEPREDVELAIASLRQDYEGRGGLQLVEVAGGYQIVTRPEMHEWVRRLFHERKTQKLSVQALETLAVIAYKQPITAPEMAEIRGVNTAGVLNTLLERHLIKISGRKAVVGRPFLYSTTREFLIRFGLRDLSDLPKVEDMADVLGFELPAGLADSGPSEGRLPLELEGENDTPENAEGAGRSDEVPPGEEQVH